jgi:hypothetical protein
MDKFKLWRKKFSNLDAIKKYLVFEEKKYDIQMKEKLYLILSLRKKGK